jgi:Ni/Co efflux regulator RcnB
MKKLLVILSLISVSIYAAEMPMPANDNNSKPADGKMDSKMDHSKMDHSKMHHEKDKQAPDAKKDSPDSKTPAKD